MMRVVRPRFAALVLAAFVAALCLHTLLFSRRSPTIEEIQRGDEAIELACRHPDLDYRNPLILKHIVDLGDLDCKRETDWVEIYKGVVSINKIIAKRHGRISCTLTYLNRVDDFSSVKGRTDLLTSDLGSIPLQGDYFHVKCDAKDGLKWKNIMAGVLRNETAVKRAKAAVPPEHATKLNVLMFGLDSMSRLHYMRKLPKTYRHVHLI